MNRAALSADLAGRNDGVSLDHPARVAIGGVDAAGKTTRADDLVEPLEALGRPVIRASVDGFHRPRAERYRRGADSPEGHYHHSFDYVSLREELLSDASDSRLKPEEQLGPGGSLRYRTATFDYRTDDFLYKPLQTAPSNAVLLFDGIFLLRPELNDLWDFRIFLDVGFEVSVERAVERNAEGMEFEKALRERFEQRYVPGQRLYLESVKPQELADVVVDNGDVGNPSGI